MFYDLSISYPSCVSWALVLKYRRLTLFVCICTSTTVPHVGYSYVLCFSVYYAWCASTCSNGGTHCIAMTQTYACVWRPHCWQWRWRCYRLCWCWPRCSAVLVIPWPVCPEIYFIILKWEPFHHATLNMIPAKFVVETLDGAARIEIPGYHVSFVGSFAVMSDLFTSACWI